MVWPGPHRIHRLHRAGGALQPPNRPQTAPMAANDKTIGCVGGDPLDVRTYVGACLWPLLLRRTQPVPDSVLLAANQLFAEVISPYIFCALKCTPPLVQRMPRPPSMTWSGLEPAFLLRKAFF